MKSLILLFMFTVIFGSFQIAQAQTNREIKLSVNGQKAIDRPEQHAHDHDDEEDGKDRHVDPA